MTRNDFLARLRAGLVGNVPAGEVNRLCDYYDEMILDLMEDGKTEREAVAAMGQPNELVYAAVDAAPTPRRGHRWGLWLLVILGAPLWGSLALAAACVGFAGEVMLWCVPLVTGCSSFGFLLGGVMATLMSPAAFFAAPFYGVTELGAGLAMLGFGLLAAWLTWHIVKYCGLAHAWAWRQLVAAFSSRKAAWA